MLEEILSRTTHSPAEASLALLQFVQVELQAGGAASEARFFKLFTLLCERLFGPLAAADKEYIHQVGGWLSRETRWERPPSSAPSPRSAYRVGPSSQANRNSVSLDPVVKLLGASAATSSASSSNDKSATKSPSRDFQQPQPPTLIESFAKEAEHRPNVRYNFPFQALPQATQDAWMAVLEQTLAPGSISLDKQPSENSKRLFDFLLRVKPIEQNQLLLYQQRKAQKKDNRRPLQLSPSSGYRNPVASPAGVNSSSGTPSKNKEVPPNIMLSMLEYYFFVFVRYPLKAPQPDKATPSTVRGGAIVSVPRMSGHYGESVYYQLFAEYVKYFIPCNRSQGHYQGFDALDRPAELFLRIVAQLWMEGQNVLHSTERAAKGFAELKAGQVDPLNLELCHSFDLVHSKYTPPPPMVKKCLQRMIVRSVCDGAMYDAAKDIQSRIGGPTDKWCLSPSLTALQQPFFNHVRNAFRYASIHASQSPFYAALDAWLVWIEPWNVTHTRKYDIVPHPTSSLSALHLKYLHICFRPVSYLTLFWLLPCSQDPTL